MRKYNTAVVVIGLILMAFWIYQYIDKVNFNNKQINQYQLQISKFESEIEYAKGH